MISGKKRNRRSIENTLMLIGAVLRKDNIVYRADLAADLPKIKCRSQQIQQVLMNLLTNARDALNERYPGRDPNKMILVKIRPFERDGELWVRTTVEDHGSGIPAAMIPSIFDPFFTTKPKERGTGLGLSISYGIVKEHHGELLVESEPNHYTRLHVELRVDGGERLESLTRRNADGS